MQTLATVTTLPVIESSLLPVLSTLSTDEIPNIRFNVAKAYGTLIEVMRSLPENTTSAAIQKQFSSPGNSSHRLPPSQHGIDLIHTHILPDLDKLRSDDDIDVRYFATRASEIMADQM